MSADGRYVALASAATNLVPNDKNGQFDIFVKDMKTGAVNLVSVAADGSQGTSGSFFASISPDGQSVVFSSHSPNLVKGDNNDDSDVFLAPTGFSGGLPDITDPSDGGADDVVDDGGDGAAQDDGEIDVGAEVIEIFLTPQGVDRQGGAALDSLLVQPPPELG